MSVSEIERRAKEVIIRNGRAEIRNMENKQIMCLANRKSDLYIVQARTIINTQGQEESNNVTIKDSSLWHRRFCHINNKIIQKTAESNQIIGFENGRVSEDICEDCCIGKSTKAPCRKLKDRQSQEVCELIHSDVCGPMQVGSLSGKRYFVTFIDDYSRHTTVAFIKTKDEVKYEIKKYIANTELQAGRKIRRFRADNGREYCYKDLKVYFEEKGIKHEKSNVETPQMNGIAERTNRTLLDLVRSMLKSAQLPQKFWAEAIATAAYVRNRVCHSSLKDQIPLAIWTNKTPSIRHLKAYGSLAYAHLVRQGQKKLDDRAVPCVMVGYASQTKAYRLWCPKTQDVIVTKHVRFLEEKMGYEWLHNECGNSRTLDNNHNYRYVDIDSDDEDKISLEHPDRIQAVRTDETVGVEDVQSRRKRGRPKKRINNPYGRKGKPRAIPAEEEENREELDEDEENESSVELNFMEIIEPDTLDEAMSSPQAQKWEQAIHEEMTSLKQRGTWKTVSHIPPGRKSIGSKWVFKLKC